MYTIFIFKNIDNLIFICYLLFFLVAYYIFKISFSSSPTFTEPRYPIKKRIEEIENEIAEKEKKE
jgi:predicted RND superfamily exporter protein